MTLLSQKIHVQNINVLTAQLGYKRRHNETATMKQKWRSILTELIRWMCARVCV